MQIGTGARFTVMVRLLGRSLLLAVGLSLLIGSMLSDVNRTLAGGPAAIPAATAGDPAAGLRAVTLGGHMDGFSSWSPDGRQIAFMRDGRIFLVSPDGSGVKGLGSAADGWDVSPVWQPDGKAVTFIRLFPEARKSQIVSVDPATGAESVLVKSAEPMGYLAWAPDGKRLYYTTSQRLLRYDSATRRTEPVHVLAGDWEMLAGGIAVSPNGRQVVFGAGPREGQGVRYDLWLLWLDGQRRPSEQPQRLTSGGGIMPSFHPKLDHIVYRNPRRGTGLYLLNLSNHSTKRILADSGKAMYFHPAISPDAKSLAVSGLALGGEKDRPKLISQLFVMELPASR